MGRPTGSIKAARLDNSPRLQRLMYYLADMREHTTLDIIHGANLCAISAAVCELRKNLEPYGIKINCRKREQNTYSYQMVLQNRGAV